MDISEKKVNHIKKISNDLPFQMPISFPEFQKEGFDNFVVCKANRLAYNTAVCFCKNSKFRYRKLYFYGDRGKGKSHLLKAIGQYYSKYLPKLNTAYICLDRVSEDYHKTSSYNEIAGISNIFKKVDLLLIDDIDLCEGDTLVEDQIFHIFNELSDNNKGIVMAGRRSPEQMQLMQEHLRSRLCTCVTAKIGLIDDSAKKEILKKVANDKGVVLPLQVRDYILNHFNRDVVDFQNLFNIINTYSLSTKRRITIPFIKEIIGQVMEKETVPASNREIH